MKQKDVEGVSWGTCRRGVPVVEVVVIVRRTGPNGGLGPKPNRRGCAVPARALIFIRDIQDAVELHPGGSVPVQDADVVAVRLRLAGRDEGGVVEGQPNRVAAGHGRGAGGDRDLLAELVVAVPPRRSGSERGGAPNCTEHQ